MKLHQRRFLDHLDYLEQDFWNMFLLSKYIFGTLRTTSSGFSGEKSTGVGVKKHVAINVNLG